MPSSFNWKRLNIVRDIFLVTLVAVFLLQSVNRAVIVAGFYCNRNFISVSLCEQKNVRNNCCKGSCHLRKQLNDEDQKDQSTLPGSSREQNESQYCVDNSTNLFEIFFLAGELRLDIASYSPQAPIFSIFHPPEAVHT